MIISMDVELLYLGVSVIVTILVTTIVSTLSTRSIIRESAKDTRCILDKLAKILDRTECTAAKTMFLGKCQLVTQGYEVKEDVENREEAKKLGEVLGYDSRLKICAYKPKKEAGTN